MFFAVDIKPFVIVGHATVREPKNGMRFLKDPTVIGIKYCLDFFVLISWGYNKVMLIIMGIM